MLIIDSSMLTWIDFLRESFICWTPAQAVQHTPNVSAKDISPVIRKLANILPKLVTHNEFFILSKSSYRIEQFNPFSMPVSEFTTLSALFAKVTLIEEKRGLTVVVMKLVKV